MKEKRTISKEIPEQKKVDAPPNRNEQGKIETRSYLERGIHPLTLPVYKAVWPRTKNPQLL